MSKIKLTCFGCGCELQNSDPTMSGYTPKLVGEGTILCQRCYRLQHYGEHNDEVLFKPDYKSIFSNLVKNKSLIVYVVDLFSFESSLIRELFPFIKDNPILVVANKRDILPKSISDEKLKEFVYKKFQAENVQIEGVICSSAYKNYNINEIIQACASLRRGKDIYIVGASSVGKSSIINVLLKTIKNVTRNVISTSPYPGTTVATITIPIDNKSKIYDTPGIVPPNSMFSVMEKSVLKVIIPKSEIKPVTYQLNDKQTIFMGGIARFDYVKGSKTGFTFYLSNNVELHRTKMEKAEKVLDSLISQNKIKPISSTVPSSLSLVKHELVLPNYKCDVCILGLGWVSVKGNGQIVNVWAPQGVNVIIRESKI